MKSGCWACATGCCGTENCGAACGWTGGDCGAAKLAFGEDKVASKESETEAHAGALSEFRAQVNKRYPKLSVITGIMAIDGRVDLVG